MAYDKDAILSVVYDGMCEGRKASIYGLYDKSGHLRYIGKANNPASRLRGHMRETRRKSPLYDWIAKHGEPTLRILEADCADWREAERRLIAEARLRGERLLNLADGGDEPHCPKDVRASNGRNTAAAIHSDPKRKQLWYLKKQLAVAIKEGFVSNAKRAQLRNLAARQPAIFGDWLNLPDRVEA